MKKLTVVLGLLFVINAFADIEHTPDQDVKPTIIEISQNRACFEEVALQGCGDPGEDAKHFRECVKNVTSTLTPTCKKMMTDLYGP